MISSEMVVFGREEERAALGALRDRSRAGHGGSLVLRGEVGVGLSTLLEHAVHSASDMRVVRMAGAESERGLAFAALDHLCFPVLDRLDEVPGPQRNALASALGMTGDGVADVSLVGRAVLTLVSETADHRPVLCAIDDAQWLDDASVSVLTFVARRLGKARVALVLATHDITYRRGPLSELPELTVGPLADDAARQLLASIVRGPLDGRVRERIVKETGGIPLGLVEVAAQLSQEHLAGVCELPEPLPVGDRVKIRLLGGVAQLPADTQQLLLVAASDPWGDARVFWQAAERIGLDAGAARHAESAGLLRIGDDVVFHNPVLRLAVLDAAPVAERQRVHRAFSDVIDAGVEPDRWVWHRAAASLVPDEGVARELEASADRAKARHDYEGTLRSLERSAGLTSDAGLRYRRTLAAAQAALAGGALGRASALLNRANPQPDDPVQRAQADRLRGAIGLALGEGVDRATLLLRAARAFETVDPRLARDTYLEALEVATFAGTLSPGASLVETAHAARSAPRPREPQPTAADFLLDGLAALIAGGRRAAVPLLRRAIELLGDGPDARWQALASLGAIEIWADDELHHLRNQLRPGQPATGSSERVLELDQMGDLDDILEGRFWTLTASLRDRLRGRDLRRQADVADDVTPGELIASAWCGLSTITRAAADACMREAFARGLGLYVAVAHHAVAVLEVGLGRYEAALTAACEACEEPALYVVTSTLPELIEAAVRSGARELAVSGVARLSERVLPCRTDWGLGVLARSRALLEEGADADELYRDSIVRLRRSRAAPQLARAHLLYGEWLRRERRRREAREQLTTARDMFVFMGAQAFAERARTELAATGERTSRRLSEGSRDGLTAQEARIAELVGEGATNAEIAAQLFISPRTVEYHLHKVFRKLGVSTRTQLARALLETGDPSPSPD